MRRQPLLLLAAAARALASVATDATGALDFTLDHKVAWVTGASRGLGLAIATAYAKQGATVVLSGRDENSLRRAVEHVTEACPDSANRCHALAFDVADAAECDAALSRLVAAVGRSPDILVNNAGINRRAPLASMGDDDFNAVLQANLVGPFVLCRGCAPAMRARKWGRIIMIGSIYTLTGRENVCAYAASKHAISGLAKSLAAELAGDGVTVNTICPGYFRTQLTDALQQDELFDAQVRSRSPMGRWGEPHEIAGPAVFFASEASAHCNGATLVVDGGMIETMHF